LLTIPTRSFALKFIGPWKLLIPSSQLVGSMHSLPARRNMMRRHRRLDRGTPSAKLRGALGGVQANWRKHCWAADRLCRVEHAQFQGALSRLWAQTEAEIDRSHALGITEADAAVTSLAEAVDVVSRGGTMGRQAKPYSRYPR